MNIVGKSVITEFSRHHADAKKRLNSWVLEVEEEQWSKPTDITNRYPSASWIGENQFIFNICHNNYRLLANIDYEVKTVQIVWIKTHADYDRQVF